MRGNIGGVKNISDEIEENEYIDQAAKGEIALGLTTGWPALDPYIRLKEHSLNIGLGLDGVDNNLCRRSSVGARHREALWTMARGREGE